MRQHGKTLERSGTRVLVVTFESPERARGYREETGLEWPILLDPDRSLYRTFGMERGRFWDIWGPASWRAYAALMMRGQRPRASSADPRQLGGDVLIDPRGVVRYHHIGKGPADRPSVDELLARMC